MISSPVFTAGTFHEATIKILTRSKVNDIVFLPFKNRKVECLMFSL